MKKYALLLLFPCGHYSGNKILSEYTGTWKDALEFFQKTFPTIPLNENGFHKIKEITYCIAEFYNNH